jgi:3-methylcrotonyl-CoA carboxylase alpha subunit
MSFVRVDEAGRSVRLAVVRTASGVWVGWPGGARFFTREDRRQTAAAADGPQEVRAPMTGRVVKIAVATGLAVVADDLLVILQAMKMEYRLTAPHAGVVDRVDCAEGEMVELGALLVTFRPEESTAPPARRKGRR